MNYPEDTNFLGFIIEAYGLKGVPLRNPPDRRHSEPPAIGVFRKMTGKNSPMPDPANLPIDHLPRFALSALAFAVTGRLANRLPRWVNKHIEGDWNVRGPGLQLIGLMVRMKKVTMTQAAEALDLTPGGITRIVKELEQAGLLSRSENPEDRRQSFISLTSLAKKKAKVLLPLHDQLISRVTETLSDDELRSYLKVAIKLTEALRDESSL